MNILNENEAIVINSLENWEKVAEILDRHNVRWRENEKASEFKPVSVSRFFVYTDVGFLRYDKLDKLMNKNTIKYITKDTDFIAKHSKNIFQEQMEAFYSQDYKTDTDMAHEAPYGIMTKFQKNEEPKDKNMKIVVKKENGLLEVGKEYVLEKVLGTIGGCKFSFYYCKSDTQEIEAMAWQIDLWLKNGYIEEVKEVSYRFADIYDGEGMNLSGVATNKQFDQVLAYMKLTHVRTKILKDNGYSENWETGEYGGWIIEYVPIKQFICIQIYDKTRLALTFPTRELAELALQHNQELFKTYLGV